MSEVRVRAARGAIHVEEDSSDEVLSATERLLTQLLERNEVAADDIVSAFFTVTEDLRSVFPAEAARRMGLGRVPLLCARPAVFDIAVPPTPNSRHIDCLAYHDLSKRRAPRSADNCARAARSGDARRRKEKARSPDLRSTNLEPPIRDREEQQPFTTTGERTRS